MRDHEARAPLHEPRHRLLDKRLGAGVHRAGGLIEDEDRRVGHERTRDREQLPLTLRDVGAVVVELGVVSVGQRTHEVVHVRGVRGGHDLLVGSVFTTIREVLADCALEQPRVLQDHAEGTAQVVAGHVACVHAVDQDAAILKLIEAHEEVHERGLAGAGGPDDSDRLARQRFEGQVLDQRFVGRVAEPYVAELHMPLGTAQMHGLEGLRYLLGSVEKLEDALGGRRGRLQHVGRRGGLHDRLVELARVLDERLHVTERERPARDLETADDGHAHVVEVVEEVERRLDRARDELGAERRLVQALVLAVEHLYRLGLTTEDLHHVVPREHLLHMSVQGASLLPLRGELRA